MKKIKETNEQIVERLKARAAEASYHPLYLEVVTLHDGRTGTIIEVHDNGAAFTFEPFDATGIEDFVTVYPGDLGGHHPSTRVVAIGRLKGNRRFAANLDSIRQKVSEDDDA